MAVAAYIVYESGSTLIQYQSPERSIPGILVAAVSVVVMPLLARERAGLLPASEVGLVQMSNTRLPAT
jgi:divalent metal cation (Fe/Co/Zn/Cd) transporter